MLLLFVGGVMALPWIAALSVLVFVEKVTRFGRLLARAAGIALVIAGIGYVASSLPPCCL